MGGGAPAKYVTFRVAHKYFVLYSLDFSCTVVYNIRKSKGGSRALKPLCHNRFTENVEEPGPFGPGSLWCG